MSSIGRILADCHFTSNYVSVEKMHSRKPDVIWDCVDLERFCPGECSPDILKKYGLPDKRDGFVVMTLGRLEKRAAHKGTDEIDGLIHDSPPHAYSLRKPDSTRPAGKLLQKKHRIRVVKNACWKHFSSNTVCDGG